MDLEKFKNKKIAVIGFGKEWKSTYNFLKNHWVQNIIILDKRNFEDFDDEEKNFLKNEKYILGAKYLDNLNSFDFVFKSPWVSPYQDKLINFREKLLDQTQIFFDNFEWKIIAVSGTKWKTTTTTLIYELLKNAWYNAGVIWNIGNPPLDYLDSNYDFVVYEMSSYMLELANINPYISVLVNIFPEHLDYHQTFENYQKAKLNIIWKDSIIIYNNELENLIWKYKNKKIAFWNSWDFFVEWDYFWDKTKKLYPTDIVKIIGDHNLNNICAVNTVAEILGISIEILSETVKQFEWVKHRLEYVWTKNWILFYDDAISTTPQSTMAAIKSLGDKVETIFLWWTDRGYNFQELAKNILNSSIKNIVFFPDTWIRIKNEISLLCLDLSNRFNILETKKMEDAVKFAFENTEKGKVCLLSCASPSYSLWKNFEEKWDEFKKFINLY